jgi:nucleoside-triphosphatase THEP1
MTLKLNPSEVNEMKITITIEGRSGSGKTDYLWQIRNLMSAQGWKFKPVEYGQGYETMTGEKRDVRLFDASSDTSSHV